MPLEEVPLEEARDWSGPLIFNSTIKFLEGSISAAEYRYFRSILRTAPFGFESDRTCLVFGYGSQPRHVYEVLSAHDDIDVLWSGTCCSLILLPLSLGVACHSGLLRVNTSEAARVALHLLSYRGPAEVLSFSSNVTDQVVRHVKRLRLWGFRNWPEEIVGDDPTYFLFHVERDHPDTETGIQALCSFGPDCPSELQSFAEGLVAN